MIRQNPPETEATVTRDGGLLRAADERADHIRKVVDSAPPLSRDQRERLALILHGHDAGAA